MILDPGLNRAILALAPAHEVRDQAPKNWHEVREASTIERVIVWSGEAHHSIYGDARVNYAFRAWHDKCHLIGGFPFTIHGEERAVALQCEQLERAFPGAPKLWRHALEADVLGVVYLLHKAGVYVADQAAHVRELLAMPKGLAAIKPEIERRKYAYGEE